MKEEEEEGGKEFRWVSFDLLEEVGRSRGAFIYCSLNVEDVKTRREGRRGGQSWRREMVERKRYISIPAWGYFLEFLKRDVQRVGERVVSCVIRVEEG